jgi:hypothetical protein
MAREFKLEVLEAFTGGLNLRSDQFNLADNESPDMLNVVVDPRGGIRQRDGVDRLNTTALSADIEGIWGFHTDSGTNQIMVNYGTKVAYATSANFTDLTGITARTSGSRVYGITMNNVAYGVSRDQVSFKWDGSTASDLGTTLDGTTGNFPTAQYVAFWNNFAWVANTVESGTDYKYRVRWSNVNDPEKWTAADYVDIDKGEHGDYITGIVPMGDRLLVFKTNSVHAIFGWDSDSFQVVTLTHDVGSIALSSPASTTFGAFFWHATNGIYVYDGRQFTWVFDKLQPAIDDGRIDNLITNPPQLAWGNNKLYVSVDWTENGTTARRTLVYDPTLGGTVSHHANNSDWLMQRGEGGAWVSTDIDAAPLYAYRPPNAAPTVYGGCVANTGVLIDVEDPQNRTSDRYVGATEAHISSYFVTRWVSGRDPIVKKRWGRPRVVVSAEATVTLPVTIYKDYDKSEQSNSFDLSISGKVSQSRWDTAKWDDADSASAYFAEWDAVSSNLTANVQNLPTLGTGRSISMKVNGPSSDNHWEVNALAFTYTPRRLR